MSGFFKKNTGLLPPTTCLGFVSSSCSAVEADGMASFCCGQDLHDDPAADLDIPSLPRSMQTMGQPTIFKVMCWEFETRQLLLLGAHAAQGDRDGDMFFFF
jgi:hypothetical protein